MASSGAIAWNIELYIIKFAFCMHRSNVLTLMFEFKNVNIFGWAIPHWEFSFATLVARKKKKCAPISVNALCWMNEWRFDETNKKVYIMNDAGWYLFRWI